MIFDVFDLKTVATIVHVFGAIIGAGGAFVSDGIFFKSVEDGKIDRKEIEFLIVGSKFVWIGLFILILSGLVLVFTDVSGYLSSSKFLAKMTIVGVITLNGLIFHFLHIPHIRRHEGIIFRESPEFLKKSNLLAASGAISLISWICAVMLGSIRTIPASYALIISMYAFLLILGCLGAVVFKKQVLRL